MKQGLKVGFLACILTSASIASTIIVGSDGSGQIQFYAPDGSQIGVGPNGTAGAQDSLGDLFVATPGDSSSVVSEYGPGQNLIDSFSFTGAGDSRPDAAYIIDMSMGASGTLWLSTFTGKIYHVTANGTILGSFDTGDTSPGVTVYNNNVYTTSGPGFDLASPFIYQRNLSGTILDKINTGLSDTLGLGYDSSNGTFWVGGFDVLSQVDSQGNVLQTFAIDGTHYGVEVAPPISVSSVPEPANWALILISFAGLALWKLRPRLLTVGRCLLYAASAATLAHGAVTITSFTPNLTSPQPVGTPITFTAVATDSDPGPLRYRFQIQPVGGALTMLRDFSPANSVTWTPSENDGMFEVEVTALNHSTKSTHTFSVPYAISARVTGSTPVVSRTVHPLVALYSAPACPAGSNMRVRFKLTTASLWETTNVEPCNGSTTMNFYVAGMRASSTYDLRQDVITGPQVVTGPQLTFTTGAITGITVPPTNAIIPLKPPSSQTEGVVIFGGLDPQGPYAVDPELNVIWYAITQQVYMTRFVYGGDYLVTYGYTTDLTNSGLREYDIAGNLVKETNVERMNDELAAVGTNHVTTFHHEIRKLKNGNYLLLAQKEVASTVQGPPDDIAGDMILVLDNNLQLLWSWDSFAHLDLTRVATLNDGCPSQPGLCVLFHSSTAHDWTHGNSVALTPDGNILYSARSQDFVYKIAYENGAGDGHVIWKLGKGGDFTLSSSDPYPWFSHQHDVEYELATTISLFDDGNTRVAVEGGGNSRGQALDVNETNKTVKFILNVDLGSYSFALGSAQRLLNGNYVFDSGFPLSAPNTQFSEWSPSGTEVSNLHTNQRNYRCFRMRNLFVAPQ